MLHPDYLSYASSNINGVHSVHTFGEEKFNFGKTASYLVMAARMPASSSGNEKRCLSGSDLSELSLSSSSESVLSATL